MLHQKLKDLISTNRLAKTIDYLLAVTDTDDRDLNNDITLISSRLNALTRRNNMGLLSFDDFKTSENKITATLLNMVEELHQSGLFEKTDLKTIDEQIAKNQTGQIGQKTKILFIAANPPGTVIFELEKEYIGIRKIFRNHKHEFDITEFFDARLDDLFETIEAEKPQIIHISTPANNEIICLHNNDHTAHQVPWDFLASAFLMFKDFAQCVFVNTWTNADFLKKVSKAIPYAIGSNGLIADTESIDFSSGFYTGIASGKDIEKSFQLGLELLKRTPKQEYSGLDTLMLFHSGIHLV